MKTSTRALEHFLNEIKDDSLGRMIVFLKAISQTQTSVVLTHGPQKKKVTRRVSTAGTFLQGPGTFGGTSTAETKV